MTCVGGKGKIINDPWMNEISWMKLYYNDRNLFSAIIEWKTIIEEA